MHHMHTNVPWSKILPPMSYAPSKTNNHIPNLSLIATTMQSRCSVMLLVNEYILNTEFVHLFMDWIKYILIHVLIM